MIELPELFKRRMANILGDNVGEFLSSYDRRPYRGIRVNTLKITPAQFEKISPFSLSPVPWEPNGFYVDGDRAGKTVLHEAGLYYVQEPSAMAAAPLLDIKPGERVLDMCSAPGGKGTRLAEGLNGSGFIMMNEVVRGRAEILARNVERMGITNAAVTCARPDQIALEYESYFDKVLVDAPCSGEGMFLKEAAAIGEWSPENVEMCARRQSLILEAAQKTLKAGGLMVYSTCTFSPEENERQVENFLNSHKNFVLISSSKLYPHEVRGEGHFVALLKKIDGEERELPPFKRSYDKSAFRLCKSLLDALNLSSWLDGAHFYGNNAYAVTGDFPAINLPTVKLGVRLCEMKKDRAEPDHTLAMCLKSGDADCLELDNDGALKYLAGNAVECPEDGVGWALVTHLGYPLGWCKRVGGVAKNHLPKGIRI